MEGRHDASLVVDFDWTLVGGNWDEEWKRTEERNEFIKAKLLVCTSASYRSSGWSLYPRVHQNDCCTNAPVTSPDEVKQDDIVFWQVQRGDRFYAHLVKTKQWDDDHAQWEFIISNISGRANGWCHINHIYGRLVSVEH